MKSPKDKLEKSIEILIRSAFIRALAEIEDEFGDVWGEFEEDDNKLTKEQAENAERYEVVRKKILDYGNHQIRLMKHILKFYEVDNAGQTLIFTPKGIENGKE